MSLTLMHPWSALLLGLVAVVWYWGRRASLLQRILRCMLIGLIVLAMMQPVLIRHTPQRHHVLVLDQSASVSVSANAAAMSRLQQQIVARNDDAEIEVLQVGGKPIALRNITVTQVDAAQSSLSQLVRQALALIPEQSAGDITLISDGLATDAHWQRTLAALNLRGIQLNWLKLTRESAQPFIAQVTLGDVRIGEQPQISVSLEGLAAAQHALTLQALADGKLVSEQTLTRDQFSNRDQLTLTLELPQATTAFTQLQLRLLDDRKREPLELRNLIMSAQPAYSILYAAVDATAANKLQTLLGQGFKVQAATLPLADDINFSQYQALMLDDVRSSELPELTQKRLLNAVSNGVGLFYSGGDTAFSAGGMAEQPLAAALPVKLQQQEQQREPGVSLAIVIDSSGSMKGRPLELAKQVARLAVRKLKPQDQVGIVEFYGTRQWAVPMQSVEHPEDIERAIGRLQAQGGSELFPAIQEAYFGLKNSHNRYRHILLITDAAVEEDNYQRLLRFIAQDQMNVSTVLVGNGTEGEQRMADLANWGHGRFYAIHDEFSMVEINLHRPSTQPQSGYRQGQFSMVNSQTHSAIAPMLTGYAHVAPQAAAQVYWQEAQSSDPLLSSWRYGAGRVTALMTEPLGAGTTQWQQWPDYGHWLGQQLANTAASQQSLRLSTERVFNRLSVRVDVANHGRQPTLEWKSAIDADWQPMSLQQQAPGLYIGELSIGNNIPVLLQAKVPAVTRRAVDQAASDRYDELKVPQQQTVLLNEVVRASGGHQLLPAHELLQPLAESQGLKALALYPWILLAALLLYISEIINRRMPRRRAVVGK